MKKLLLALVVSMYLFVGFGAVQPTTAYAAVDPACDTSGSFFGFPPWYKYLDIGSKVAANNRTDKCAIIGPTDNGSFSITKALPRIGLGIAEILLRIAGLVAVGFVIFGGFRYLISQGEPEALKNAQATVVNALIGLVIAILAVTIVSFVGGKLWS